MPKGSYAWEKSIDRNGNAPKNALNFSPDHQNFFVGRGIDGWGIVTRPGIIN